MGSNGKEDLIARNAKMNTVICAKPFVIYQWLSILSKCHSGYIGYIPELPEFDDSFKNSINECNDAIFDSAIHVNDPGSMNQENIIGDDIAQI